jgi:hypothetical protein
VHRPEQEPWPTFPSLATYYHVPSFLYPTLETMHQQKITDTTFLKSELREHRAMPTTEIGWHQNPADTRTALTTRNRQAPEMDWHQKWTGTRNGLAPEMRKVSGQQQFRLGAISAPELHAHKTHAYGTGTQSRAGTRTVLTPEIHWHQKLADTKNPLASEIS